MQPPWQLAVKDPRQWVPAASGGSRHPGGRPMFWLWSTLSALCPEPAGCPQVLHTGRELTVTVALKNL